MHLFCFGLGYTAGFIADALLQRGWRVSGTTRDPEKAESLRQRGFAPLLWDGQGRDAAVAARLREATHLLISAAPQAAGDPLLRFHSADLAPDLSWVGYLSATGVYGDCGGDWMDETAPTRSTRPGDVHRLEAEAAWQALAAERDIPGFVFRLTAIYGPGRNPLWRVVEGTARRIHKPNQFFCRIHVEDIAQAVLASLERPVAPRLYNLADDRPCDPVEPIDYACELLAIAPPPLLDFAAVADDLPPRALAFWQASRRVRNDRMKRELGVVLRYPSYCDGLDALFRQEASALRAALAARP